MSNFITFLSPAKLNLGLKIVGKRPDGYHLLKSIFCLIDLMDEVQIQNITQSKISLIAHNQAWPYHTDLSYKAAVLLQQFSGTTHGCNIKLNKTIPSGAGLGGGSSNAATVLIALNKLWHLNLPNTTLIELGKQLGADVPFFIHGKNSLVEGIGEKFSSIEIPDLYFVLIKPSFRIPTKNIFLNLDLSDQYISNELITPVNLLNSKENDLQVVANKLYPNLKQITDELITYGEPAMTGSGSTLYLTYSDIESAKKVAKELQSRYNAYLVKSMSISPLYTE